MKLPRHAEIWLPGYLRNRFARLTWPAAHPMRVWLSIADHFEPFVCHADEKTAAQRVALWTRELPSIAALHCDSIGRCPRYTFFYPQEQYRPHLIDALAQMTRLGVADVEIHIHHDGEGEQDFIDRMSGFRDTLFHEHELLRRHEGKIRFGFIHGNWALDNSLPDGRWCGLNNEITLLKELGCYADFTMPCADSPAQAHTVNEIYWAVDDPARPKSYDRGKRLQPGGQLNGLLMIPGPLGIRWAERLLPRLEMGEIAGYDLPTRYRVKRWLALAPRIGQDIFIKLFTHGADERNSSALLFGGFNALFEAIQVECAHRLWPFMYVSCWEMYQAIDAIRRREDPVAAITGHKELTRLQTSG